MHNQLRTGNNRQELVPQSHPQAAGQHEGRLQVLDGGRARGDRFGMVFTSGEQQRNVRGVPNAEQGHARGLTTVETGINNQLLHNTSLRGGGKREGEMLHIQLIQAPVVSRDAEYFRK
jgi:hypothetical protein